MGGQPPIKERRSVVLNDVEKPDAKTMKSIKYANFFARLSFLIMGIAVAFICILAYWNYEDEKIFTPREGHITILDDTALAGGTVRVELSYCKHVNKPVQFTRSFVTESTVISNPTLTDVTGEGCVDSRIVQVPIPPQAATAEYRLRYSVQAEINPLKTVNQEYYSRNTVKVIGLVDQKLGETVK